MDYQKLISGEYQRVYRYLSSQNDRNVAIMDNPRIFIQQVQRYNISNTICQKLISRSLQRGRSMEFDRSMKLQTWSELDCFVNFLNIQLVAIESSYYMNQYGDNTWNQFATFALKMIVEMSKVYNRIITQ